MFKTIYKELRNRVITTPSAKKKYNNCFINDILVWREIYGLPHRVTSDEKPREFQFKLLNRYLVTNDFLNKIGVLPSPACSLCGKENELFNRLKLYLRILGRGYKVVLQFKCQYKQSNPLLECQIM